MNRLWLVGGPQINLGLWAPFLVSWALRRFHIIFHWLYLHIFWLLSTKPKSVHHFYYFSLAGAVKIRSSSQSFYFLSIYRTGDITRNKSSKTKDMDMFSNLDHWLIKFRLNLSIKKVMGHKGFRDRYSFPPQN